MKHFRLIIYVTLLLSLLACKSKGPSMETMDFMAVGDSLSKDAFDTLSHLMTLEIANGGWEKAIEVCQKKVPELTGMLSNKNTIIRRTALKVRNPANAADDLEKSELAFYHKLFEAGDSIKPKLVAEHSGKVHYFKPIKIQPLCLNCHGVEGENIAPATLAILNKTYPNDQAKGYKTGDLRGLWHITFNPFLNKED
jgi:cytochrome c553